LYLPGTDNLSAVIDAPRGIKGQEGRPGESPAGEVDDRSAGEQDRALLTGSVVRVPHRQSLRVDRESRAKVGFVFVDRSGKSAEVEDPIAEKQGGIGVAVRCRRIPDCLPPIIDGVGDAKAAARQRAEIDDFPGAVEGGFGFARAKVA
jgi:hypothetical protein